jgi:hypothetical protein
MRLIAVACVVLSASTSFGPRTAAASHFIYKAEDPGTQQDPPTSEAFGLKPLK